MEEWDTLYFAGRLHKPVSSPEKLVYCLITDCQVLPLQTSSLLTPQIASNLCSALHVSLLLLPPSVPFSEIALWEQIAGISYSGDPRMSVPGAENPDKVKNIVRGPGVLDGFRRLYEGAIMGVAGLRWHAYRKEIPWVWKGEGEEMLVVSELSLTDI